MPWERELKLTGNREVTPYLKGKREIETSGWGLIQQKILAKNALPE